MRGMKKVFFLGMLGAISINGIAQNIGLGTNNPHKTAILDISSTTKGVLIPRMAALSEINIVTPEKGLLIYQNNQQRFRYNAGTALSRNFVNIFNNEDQQNNYGQWWNIAGNNTSSSNLFYGTTNAIAFLMKVDNQQVAKFGTTSNHNLFLGLEAGRLVLGNNNILIGRRASWVTNNGGVVATSHQIAIGDSALHQFKDISGSTGQNIAIGTRAQGNMEDGWSNIALGHYALLYGTNSPVVSGPVYYNVAIGYRAMKLVNDERDNVVIGTETLTSGSYIGRSTIVGNNADATTSGGNNSKTNLLGASTKIQYGVENITAIGYEAKAIGTLANRVENLMVFGNENVTKWAFGRSTTDANVALQVGTNNTNGNGAYLTRTGTWTNVSDQNKKEDFTQIDTRILLQKLENLPITRWQYKAGGGWHIGPMAQDFKAVFDLGSNDNKTINTVDPIGIALAAAKALLAETETLKQRITALEQL